MFDRCKVRYNLSAVVPADLSQAERNHLREAADIFVELLARLDVHEFHAVAKECKHEA